jgi:hypothetical protein
MIRLGDNVPHHVWYGTKINVWDGIQDSAWSNVRSKAIHNLIVGVVAPGPPIKDILNDKIWK